MAEQFGRRFAAGTEARGAEFDEGLRSYMLGVYNYMAGGVLLTGLVAYLVSQSPALLGAIYGTPLAYVVMFMPMIMGWFFAARINKMSASGAQMAFWVFAALMGLALSYIFVVYTGMSITRVFFITSATFAGLSLWGYTTKKDLSGWGTFLIMATWGLFVALLVNWFIFESESLDIYLSIGVVLIFSALTAYDTQKIKRSYWEGDSQDVATKKSIMGATELYLDFVILFVYLLRLLGSRD